MGKFRIRGSSAKMIKSKCSEQPRDRLSELPDSLILQILSLLPMRDVVRTTLLSKRWKNLWTSVPYLDFEDDANDLFRFQNFVNRALILWKGSKILRFSAVFHFDLSASSDLDLWLRVAMENEVEELNVNLINDADVLMGFDDTEYWAPPRLYSCSSIRELSLFGCNLKINGNVRWNQLKSLRIEGVRWSENVINQLMSGAPQLEILILRLMESHENLSIQSSSLKTLEIDKFVGIDDESAMDTMLTIWAPKVETLEISGVLYSKYLLVNVSSLSSAALLLSVDEGYTEYEEHGETMGQVFERIHHAEKVALSDWCIKVLGVMKEEDLLSPPSDAKFLRLYGSEVEEIMDLLEMFPKLTMLVVEGAYLEFEKKCITKPAALRFGEMELLETKPDFPKFCLLHLRTVEITWIASDTTIYRLIEFLLKYASMLEKMVFRASGVTFLTPESLLLASQRLLSMPRSSPNAEVILCEA